MFSACRLPATELPNPRFPRQARSVLRAVVAFLLVVGALGVVQSSEDAATPVAAQARSHRDADPAGHQGVVPNWQKLTTWQAVWPRPLSESSMYWTTDASAPTGSTVGSQVNMIWEAYDWAPDMSTYKTRAAMAFKRVATGAPNLNADLFTVMAMARFGGTRTNPDTPMSMYFWDHYANTTNAGLTCTSGYTPIVRVTSGSLDVYWACMPIHDNYVGNGFQPRLGNANSAGGEADQYTGNLYVLQGINATVDNQTQTSRNANTSSGWVFSVWNPVTGAYSLSGAIQPGDWKQGMTTVPKERVKIRQRVDGANNFDTPHSPADMALDSDGNGYTYTGNSTSQNATTGTGNASLVRFEPARDSSGDIIDGTADNPWRYYVVTKIRKDPNYPSQYWSAPGEIYGNAFLNGQYFNAAYTATYNRPTGFPATGSAGARGTTNMVKVDPMSGTAKIVWSTLNDDLTTSIARDNASPQEAEVIRGTLWNDANGDGAITDDEPGIDGATVGIYDSVGKLRGTQLTDANGNYTFLVGGDANTTYHIRPVQVQLPLADGTLVNAAQTWGAGSVTTGRSASGGVLTNTAAIRCANGDITAEDGGVCHGAKPAGSPDPAIGAIGTTSDPATWPTYATVEMQTSQQVGYADFGFTVFGSYGDAAAGPTTAGVPVHVNNLDPAQRVWLGDVLGGYDGPATDDSHGADDGVYLDSPVGKIPLVPGTTLAATKRYVLAATVSGGALATATVNGWVTGVGNNTWNAQAAWNPTIAGDKASGPFQYQASGPVSGTPTGQLRAQVSTASVTAPTNSGNQYQAAAGDSAQPWTTPGEIEDYQFKLADAVYRPAATTATGAGTFTVDGQALTADAAAVKIGSPTAVPALTAKTVTASAPNSSWKIASVEVLDTVSGQPAAGANPSVTIAGTTATVTFTPQLGDDLTVKVTYAKPPDPKQSSLALYTDPALTQPGDTATVNTPLHAVVTVKDADGLLLAGQPVTFAATAGLSVSGANPCTTNAAGQCGVQVTSATAGTYADGLRATVADANGAPAEVSGSPATVSFTSDQPDPLNSTLTVTTTTPAATAVVANGTDSWTATATMKDAGGNPVGNREVTFAALDPATGSQAAGASISGGGKCATNAQGTCSVTVASTKTGTVNIVLQAVASGSGQLVDVTGSPAPVTFVAGPVCVPGSGSGNCLTKVEITTNNQVANGVAADVITATAYDAFGNLAGGVRFDFTAAGSALQPGSGSCTTGGTVGGTPAFGTCVLEEKTQVAGAHPVTASVNGAQLPPTAGLALVFLPGPVDPSKSSLALSSDTAAVGGSVIATVTAVDAHGNPVPAASFDLSLTKTPSGATSATFSGAATTVCTTPTATTGVDAGKCAVSVTDAVAESVDVHATFGGVEIGAGTTGSSPKTVEFSATGPCAANSTFTVARTSTNSDASKVIANGSDSWTGTVTLRDCSAGQNLVKGAAGQLVIDAPTDVSASQPVDNNDGTYTVVFKSSKASDSYQATASLGADLIQAARDIPFKPGPVAPGQSSLTVAPAQVGVNGTSTATVTTTDANGNLVGGVDVVFQLSGDATFTNLNTCTTGTSGAGLGKCSVDLTDAKAETVDVSARINNTLVGGAARQVKFTEGVFCTTAGASSFTLAPTTQAAGGGVTAVLTATDCAGNVLSNLDPAKVTFAAADPELKAGAVANTGNGTYTATLTSTKAGTYLVTAAYDTQATNDSAKAVTFTSQPTPNPTNSTLAIDKTSATVGDQVTATVTAKDAYGNPVANYQVAVTASKSGSVIGACVTGANGVCAVKVTDDTAETIDVDATVNGVGVSGSPKTVTFGFGQVDPDKSGLAVDLASQTAGSNVTVTVTVKDAAGNGVTGLTAAQVVVTGTSPGLPDLVLGSFAEVGKGVYTYKTTSKDAGTFALVGQVNGVTITQQPDVTFTAGSVCVSGCQQTERNKENVTRFEVLPANNNQFANGTAADIVSAFAYDTYGNPVANAPVSVTDVTAGVLAGALKSTADGTGTGAAQTGADGTAQVGFTSAKAGTFQVQGSIGGLYPPSSNVQLLSFVPGSVDPSRSTLSLDRASATVGQAVTATVTARDAAGNPVGGVPVQVGSDSANVMFEGTAGKTATECTTAASGANLGSCQVTLTSKVSGDYHVTASVGGSPISGSPAPVSFTTDPAPCVTNCEGTASFVEVTRNNARNDGTALDVVTAHVHDRYGNPISGARVETTPVTATLNVKTGSATTGGGGDAQLAYSSLAKGKADANVTITSGGQTVTLPVSMQFVSVQGDPGQSSLAIDSTASKQVDQAFTVTATVLGAQGQPVEGAEVTFDRSSGLLIFVGGAATCTTMADGACSVQVTSTKAGTYQVGATIPDASGADTAVSNSPVTAVFTAKDPCLVALGCAPDPGVPTTSVTMTRQGALNDDQDRDVATVSVYDQHGNPVAGAAVTAATSDATLHIVAGIDPTGGNGQTSIYFTSLVDGPHSATVTVSGGSVTGAPAGSPVVPEFASVSASPEKSSFAVTPVVSGAVTPLTVGTDAAATYRVTATVHGAQDQPLAGVVVSFGIAAGPVWANNQKTCTTVADGTCSVTVYSTKAGTFDVTAELPTGQIGQAQAAGWKADAASPATSFLTVTKNDSLADGSAQDVVTVNARDRFGNPVEGALVSSTKAVASDTLTIQPDVRGTNDKGQATIWYTSTVAGPHRVDVTIDGQVPQGTLPSPVTISFTPGSVSAKTSTLSLDKTAAMVGETVKATVTAKDAQGNLIGGQQIVVATDGGSTMAPASPATCTTNNTVGAAEFGACSVTITDQKSETVHVTAQANGQDISGSPAEVKFGFGAVDPAQSRLEVAPASQTAGSPVTVKVTVKDTSGSGITGLTAAQLGVTGTSSGLPDLVLGSFSETATPGGYQYTTTSKDAGTFRLVGTVDLDGTPVTITQKPDVTFTAGTVCVGASCQQTAHNAGNVTRFEVRPGENGKVANGSDQDIVRAYAYDAYGNPVAGAAVRVEDKTTGGLAGALMAVNGSSVGTATTGVDGTALVRFSSSKAGQFAVEGTIDSLGPSSRNQTLNFVPDDVSPARSTLALSSAREMVGQAVTATVTTNDRLGNPVGGVPVSIGSNSGDVKFDGTPDETEFTCVTAASGPMLGSCSVTLTSKVAGDYQVTAVAGGEIGGSPAPVKFTADPVVCVTGCDGRASYVAVTKDGALNDDIDQDVVTAHAFDKYGNPLSGVRVETTPATSTLHPVLASVTTGADGTARLRYTSLVKGEARANVTFDGATPTGSPIAMRFVDVAADPNRSSVAIDPTGAQPVDQVFTVTATVRGAQGQPVEGAEVAFENGSAELTFVNGPSCETLADGTCFVQVTSKKSGDYEIAALVRNASGVSQPVQNSPVTATFTAGYPCVPGTASCPKPDAGVDTTSVRMLVDGALNDGTARDSAIVRVYDSHGNPVSGVTVVAATPDSDLRVLPVAKTGSDGETAIYFTSLVSGDHIAYVTIDGSEVPGSPLTVNFGSVSPDPTKSSFTVTPRVPGSAVPLTVGTADASTYQVTATVKGAQGQPVAGARVTFGIAQNGTSWAGQQACTTGADGSCSAPVFSTKSGTFDVTAWVATGQVEQAKPAVWKADAPSAADSWVVLTTADQPADGDAKNVATVHVRDRWGNPVSGERPQSTKANPSDVLTIESAPDPTKADGTTTIYYQTTVAGSYRVKVLVGGVPVSGANGPSPLAMRFVRQAAPDAPVVDPSDGSVITGKGEPGSTINVTDEDGNPVPGCVGVAANDEGVFLCRPTTPLQPGTVILVTVTDDAGNVSAPTRVTVQAAEPPTVVPGKVGTGGAAGPAGPAGVVFAWLGGLMVAGAVAVMVALFRRRGRVES